MVSAVAFACALPSVAGAADYCVGSNTSCAPANHRDNLQTALTDAAGTPEADRILLGAEVYTAGTVAGYVYPVSSSPVEIVGAGTGTTVLSGQPGAESVLDVSGGGHVTTVSDLTLNEPSNAHFGFAALTTNGLARRIEVDEDPTQTANFRSGVRIGGGGGLEDSVVTMDRTKNTIGVFLEDGRVVRSSLTAAIGAQSNTGSIGQSRLFASYIGIRAYAGATSVSGTLIDVGEGDGLRAEAYAGVPVNSIAADGVTLISHSPGTTGAVASTTPDPGFGAEISLKNSVMRGFSKGLYAAATGAGHAKVTASYSDYDPSGDSTSGGVNATIETANVSNVGDAGFVGAGGGNFHLLPGSPLVDAGDPATAQGLDLDGNPLVTDGDGDGTARRDLGAFESPGVSAGGGPGGSSGPDTKAPLITGFRATPALFAVGRASTPRAARVHRGTRFRYTLSEQARVTLRLQRRLRGRHAHYRTVGTLTRSGRAGANRIRFTGRVGKRALRAGRYRARITATDLAGNRSTARTTRFRMAR